MTMGQSMQCLKRQARKIAYDEALLQLRQLLEFRRRTQAIPSYIMRRQYSTLEILIAVTRVRALRSTQEG